MTSAAFNLTKVEILDAMKLNNDGFNLPICFADTNETR